MNHPRCVYCIEAIYKVRESFMDRQYMSRDSRKFRKVERTTTDGRDNSDV